MRFRSTRGLGSLLLLAAAPLCCGCGSKFSAVTGDVSLGGKPLEMGTISFFPADGHGTTAAAKIDDGQFSASVPPGRYKVQISGFRKTGKRHANQSDPSSPIVDILEPIVPARYNTATTLTCEVQPGQQKMDFPLEPK